MHDLRFAICDVRSKRQRRHRAFTFLEVLFAVIVLGIGFIMVAAMFPAALKQTQASVEDVSASSAWLDVARHFTELAKNQVPQPPSAPGGPPQPIRYVLDQILPASGSPPAL